MKFFKKFLKRHEVKLLALVVFLANVAFGLKLGF